MRTIKIALLVVSVLVVIACEIEGCRGDAYRTFSERIEAYPVSYTGSASVTTPNGDVSCTRQGTATFVAGDDETCVLYVSYPMTIIDVNGQCVDNGDTEAWQLAGYFVKNYQVCYFTGCNDNEDYAASGYLRFFPQSTDPVTVRCSLLVGGAVQATIELSELKP